MAGKIPLIVNGNFYWREFEKFTDAEKVHPVIFCRLITNLQEVRDLLNSHFSSAHWVVSHGFDLDEVGEVGIEITGFTRSLEWSQAEYTRQKKLKDEGKIKKITVSLTSAHHIENGGSAVDFKAFFKKTKKVISSKIVAEIISPKRWLYDFMLPHYNRAGKYFSVYSDEHCHLDIRGLAVALGVRK